MARVFVVLVTVALAAMLNAAAAQDNTTTLDDIFLEYYQEKIHEYSQQAFSKIRNRMVNRTLEKLGRFYGNETTLPLKHEILEYSHALQLRILSDISSVLGDVPVQSIYDEIIHHCVEYLDNPIVNLTVKPSNVTCVKIQVWKTLASKLDVEGSVRNFSRELPPLYTKVPANCTTAFEERLGKLLSSYVSHLATGGGDESDPLTSLKILEKFIFYTGGWVLTPYSTAYVFLTQTESLISTVKSIEPFAIGNLIQPMTIKEIELKFFSSYFSKHSRNQMTWGIVKSDAGSVDLACSHYTDNKNFDLCYVVKLYQSNLDFFSCLNTDQTSTPLTWSSVSSVYFDSLCLCLLYNGSNCGVKPPRGVDPGLYCLSTLLRDFQRQVSYRPAVTYLDYAFKTPVPVCQFSKFLATVPACSDSNGHRDFDIVLSVQCYFDGLVDKHVNCSERRTVNTYNETELCFLVIFMQHVLCDADVEAQVPFYGVGDSTLVLLLTYGDGVARVLTLVTFLACPKLRNLPGKLLTGYLVTSLLRLLVVRSTLAVMELAVRLDVATDLASTFCLFCYLHFVTMCIRELRPPDSLSREEVRVVLVRFSLLGWVLPVGLSVGFFSIDEFTDHHVKIGQVCFLVCNYLALFGNVFMFFVSFKVYYDVKNDVRDIKRGSSKREDIIALFSFAIKTSVLSGAGITFRLLFTQFQGLEQLLGYYHALSSLQGLLVFLLYGCNHEARAFWQQVFCSILSRFGPRRQNVPIEIELRS